MYGLEYVSDPKMHSLNASERSCWITLLCYASASSVEGEVLNITESNLMFYAGVVNPADAEGVLAKLEGLGMIRRNPTGSVSIVNWSKRQDKEPMSGSERARRHRERAKTKEQVYELQQQPFETFWQAYPRKVGKKNAWEAWCKVNPDTTLASKILESAKKQAQSPQWTKDDGRFIPHPTTWLNQERWNDETTISRPKVGGGKFENIKSTKVWNGVGPKPA